MMNKKASIKAKVFKDNKSKCKATCTKKEINSTYVCTLTGKEIDSKYRGFLPNATFGTWKNSH